MAIAYVLHKAPYIFPIIGGRKVEHLQANMEALSISLSKEQMVFLDSLQPFDKGYPLNILVSLLLRAMLLIFIFIYLQGDPSGYPRPVRSIATIDVVPVVSAITPVHD